MTHIARKVGFDTDPRKIGGADWLLCDQQLFNRLLSHPDVRQNILGICSLTAGIQVRVVEDPRERQAKAFAYSLNTGRPVLYTEGSNLFRVEVPKADTIFPIAPYRFGEKA